MATIIDVHAHYYPPAYLAAVSKLVDLSGPAGKAARLTIDHPLIHRNPLFTGAFDRRLALMDQAGICIQVLSFSSPNIWHSNPAVRSDLVRIFNDSCAEVVERFPDRFKLFANVPLPFVDETLAEAARAFDQLGAVGLGICTHFADFSIDDERFAPFYEFVNERKGVLFLHPDPEPVAGSLPDVVKAWTIGAPFEDTIALCHLLYSDLLERYPYISWIVPHAGGVITALKGRIDEIWVQYPDPSRQLPSVPSEYLRTRPVYVDSVTPQTSLLSLAHDFFGGKHLLFGSDFPYIQQSLHDLRVALKPIHEVAWSEDEKQQVLYTNSAALLSLD